MDWKKVIWWIEMTIPWIIALPFMLRWVYIDRSKPDAGPCFGVTVITAAYWIFEPIPLVITAFFPIFLLPFFVVSKSSSVTSVMFTDTSLIFIGGFVFSIAMVRWNLHSRIALKTVMVFGLKPKILLLGVCVVTTFLGLFLSNTATALTMVPNAIAIITKLEEMSNDPQNIAPFAKALLMMIAMTCSAAGMITIIGTPPNLVLAQTVRNLFPAAPEIGFAQFMFVSFPSAFFMLVFLYIFFIFYYLRGVKFPSNIEASDFKAVYDKLGPWKPAEKIISITFACLALLWLFKSDINFGSFSIKGWASIIYGKKGSDYIKDGTVAILFAMLLFIIHVPAEDNKDAEKGDVDLELRAHPDEKPDIENPIESLEENMDKFEEEEDDVRPLTSQDSDDKKKEWVPIIEWEYTQQKMPWTILFLFAGGFALNQGFTDSGLDVWIGSNLMGITSLPLYSLILVIVIVSIIMTNLVASNTACANILLPIVASIARTSKTIHPFLLMFPSAFATSYCFIMPVATPPNLICYGTGRLTIKDFVITGSFLTIVAIIVVPIVCLYFVPPVFDAYSFPTWANTSLISPTY